MDAFLGKKYKLTSSDNFDEFMKALGVGLVTRKLGNAQTPTVELVKNGDTYTFSTYSTFKNTVITFKLGEEFDEETADGRKVKATCTFEGNVFKQVQVDSSGKTTVITREFTNDELKAVMVYEGITATRMYKLE